MFYDDNDDDEQH